MPTLFYWLELDAAEAGRRFRVPFLTSSSLKRLRRMGHLPCDRPSSLMAGFQAECINAVERAESIGS